MSDPTDIDVVPDFIEGTTNQMEIEEEAKMDNYVGTVSFTQMNLKNEVMEAITDCGFEHPSEVQSQVIPKALIQKDILCQAKSGMGKTAVFVITILNQDFCLNNYTSSLVVCHTREMAFQIEKEFKRMKKRLEEKNNKKIRVGVFVGGYSEERDIDNIKRKMPNIVIGTPGRLLSLIKRKALDLSKLSTFVVDECDKIMGSDTFYDVSEMIMKAPREKQVMLFSATISEENKKKCRSILRDPFEVFIDSGEKLFLHGLHLYYKKMEDNEKIKYLQNIIADIDYDQVMIFLEDSKRINYVKKALTNIGETVGIIYGNMKQQDRTAQYEKFKTGETRVLLSTDLCGRGIDIAKVNLVINFDMPKDSDQFLHRVGRAGRFGTKGLAISFIQNDGDIKIFDEVKKRFAVEMPELPENLNDIPSSYYK